VQSLHAKVTHAGKVSADCLDCHGEAHAVLAGGAPDSPVNHAHIPATCGRCHGQKFLMESNGVSTQPFVSYQESVHGRAVQNGSMKAAVCTDCHGSHAILPPNDPNAWQRWMGLSTFVLRRGDRVAFGHTGSQAGFHAFIYFNPQTSTAIVAAFNTTNYAEDHTAQFTALRDQALALLW